jgi:hypothetical protein
MSEFAELEWGDSSGEAVGALSVLSGGGVVNKISLCALRSY